MTHLLVSISLFAASLVSAQDLHTFSNGDVADAEKINQNFELLSAEINRLGEQKLAYSNYWEAKKVSVDCTSNPEEFDAAWGANLHLTRVRFELLGTCESSQDLYIRSRSVYLGGVLDESGACLQRARLYQPSDTQTKLIADANAAMELGCIDLGSENSATSLNSYSNSYIRMNPNLTVRSSDGALAVVGGNSLLLDAGSNPISALYVYGGSVARFSRAPRLKNINAYQSDIEFDAVFASGLSVQLHVGSSFNCTACEGELTAIKAVSGATALFDVADSTSSDPLVINKITSDEDGLGNIHFRDVNNFDVSPTGDISGSFKISQIIRDNAYLRLTHTQDSDNASPGDESSPKAGISLRLLGRTPALPQNFNKSAAGMVAYHAPSSTAFLVNADSNAVDIFSLIAPSLPIRTRTLNIAQDVESSMAALSVGDLGAISSVDVFGDILVVAIRAAINQDNGYIVFYRADGTYISAVEVGAAPNNVGFSPNGMYAVVANGGEPSDDYSIDPEGSVSIVNMAGGVNTPVAVTADFRAFNAGGNKIFTGPIRISAKSASIAQDIEPEFIAFSSDSSTAFVTLQENNAVATVDLVNAEVRDVVGFGFKNHALPGNDIDVSNRDNGVNLLNWPIYGAYMPDGLDAYEVNGITYLVTANEGDGRRYITDAADEADCVNQGGFLFDASWCWHYSDEIRVKDLDPSQFTPSLITRLGGDFQDQDKLGRLKIITNLGLVDAAACATMATTGQPLTFPDETPIADCVYENLYSFGARSFTIWDTNTGRPVYDSGSDFEVITARQLGESFNASNDNNAGDDRSDDKGPEPEAIEIAEIGDNTYAFIGLERVGGVMVYNISNPQAAQFVQYINPRDFSLDAEADVETVGDLGPESIVFVSAEDSPNGQMLLLVSNEVSGTLTVYSVNAL